MSHWIYAAVLLVMLASGLGVVVGALIAHRVIRAGGGARPAIVWLVFVLFALSLGQMVEQSRVLAFRLSLDGYIDPNTFGNVYLATWNVVSSKLLLAVAMVVGATVKLAIYCDWSDDAVTRAAAWAAVATLGVWTLLAYIIEDMMT
jgi:hypothetical protein